jgi:transaldolase
MNINFTKQRRLEIFLDTASIDEIKSIDFIRLDGITTNPSLAAKNIIKQNNNKNINKFEAYKNLLKEISLLIKDNDQPISAEVLSDNYDDMLYEALEFSKISKNVIIKLPITQNGLRLCKELVEKYSLKTNMTLCFSQAQAVLAAKNLATYISPFVGRLDDNSVNGIDLIRKIKKIFTEYNFNTKILAASIRNLNHANECFEIGVDAITMPKILLNSLYKNVLTDQGLEIFTKDWNSI